MSGHRRPALSSTDPVWSYDPALLGAVILAVWLWIEWLWG